MAPLQDTLTPLRDTDRTVADPAEDIRGHRVVDSAGTDLGTVAELLVDEDEFKVRFLEIASGGFLGIGRDKTYLPVDAIRSITDDTVTIDQTRDFVANAPEYDPAMVRDRDSYSSLLDYYGYGPYWAPGYAYPAYPFYR